MTRLVSFDLDGTLINTRELNRVAYRAAGVDVPDRAWGLRWQEWLPELTGSHAVATGIHNRKVQAYVEVVTDCSVRDIALPAARLAADLQEHGDDVTLWCLTAGSLLTSRILLRKLRLGLPVIANLTYEHRAALLADRSPSESVTVYVDDRADTIRRLHEDAPQVRGIWYDKQSYRDLRAEVGRHVRGMLPDA